MQAIANFSKGDEKMTDFQFKALMAMVMDILDRSENLEDARKAISKYTFELEKQNANKSNA